MAAKYELNRSGAQNYWRLEGGNNENILVSERYTSKASAETGIASCRTNSPLDQRYQRLTASNGQPYFVLRAANNEPIGASETYSSTAAMEVGIASCKRNGPTAPIVDNT